jgi:hypothetical protein
VQPVVDDRVSFSTIDAMMRTSYGVRFLERAYPRSSFCQFSQNASSCSPTSCADVVCRKNSYVAGKRKPSIVCTRVWKHGGTRGFRVAARYVGCESRGRAWRSRCAIFATAATRPAMSVRVKPSGKTMRSGFGIATTVTTVPVGVLVVTVE